jgi:uncharacterized protein YkwD
MALALSALAVIPAATAAGMASSPGADASTAGTRPAATPAKGAVKVTAAERELLRTMNAVRRVHGLAALRLSPTLVRPARAHSRYLVRLGELNHDGPGGAPFWHRLVDAGFPRTKAMGENLAMVPTCGAAAARQVVGLWMKSSGHRANLLSRNFRVTGVGVVSSAGCRMTVVTADYGG